MSYSCQIIISDLTAFNTAAISHDSVLKTVQYLTGSKKAPFISLVDWKCSHQYEMQAFYLSVLSILCHKYQRVLSPCSHLAHAMDAGRFDCLAKILILITTDNDGKKGSSLTHRSWQLRYMSVAYVSACNRMVATIPVWLTPLMHFLSRYQQYPCEAYKYKRLYMYRYIHHSVATYQMISLQGDLIY